MRLEPLLLKQIFRSTFRFLLLLLCHLYASVRLRDVLLFVSVDLSIANNKDITVGIF